MTEGVKVSTDKRREYFKRFKCEVLTSERKNKELIKRFTSKKAHNTLEAYLKDEDKAWTEDSDGETRVYLIKDEDGQIVLFFSVKCGVLVGTGPEYELNDEEKDFVQNVLDAMIEDDHEALKAYYSYGEKDFGERIDFIFKAAERKKHIRIESEETGQKESLRVKYCVSAIELRHFCKNEDYKSPENLGIPIGFGVFWEVIVPKILQITQTVGCKYLYLFAADNSEISRGINIKKLVNYYETYLKFYDSDIAGLKMIKPDYDKNCYGLIQEIKELEKNREGVWKEFSVV